MGEDVPDGESTRLLDGLKQRVSFNATYDVEVSVPDVQLHESSLFADDLGEFVAPMNHANRQWWRVHQFLATWLMIAGLSHISVLIRRQVAERYCLYELKNLKKLLEKVAL